MGLPQRSIRQHRNFGNTYLKLQQKIHQIEPIFVSFSLLVGESGIARRLNNGFKPQRDPEPPFTPKRGFGKSCLFSSWLF